MWQKRVVSAYLPVTAPSDGNCLADVNLAVCEYLVVNVDPDNSRNDDLERESEVQTQRAGQRAGLTSTVPIGPFPGSLRVL